MSDPFDVLRDVPAGAAPDVALIRSRARRIQRRRYVTLASSASVIVIVAAIGLFAFRPAGSKHQLAQATPSTAQENATTLQESTDSGVAPSAAPRAAVTASGGASTTSGSAGIAPQTKSADAATPLVLTLDVAKRAPRGATFTLKACNKNEQTVERSFNDAQRYDFEVSRNGTRIWRWSDGRSFSQITGTETWKPNECKTYEADWNGTNSSGAVAAPGTYKAVGVLTSSPEQRTKPKDVCLDIC